MIPVIDFSCYALDAPAESLDENRLFKLADEIHEAFRTIGFVYLKNSGISESQIVNLSESSREFFLQPPTFKKQFARGTGNNDGNNGWVSLERERLNPERPPDLKEAFNFGPGYKNQKKLNPIFQQCVEDVFSSCTKLANRILELMAIGLKLSDKQFFAKCHSLIGEKGNATALRCLYYPPLPEDKDIKTNQVRCGEHFDYGSITLLFQDEVGGLQVHNVSGVYIAAPPIKDTVLVNLGGLMERWTADKLKATKHRVLIPDSEQMRKQVRQSVAFFVQPDDDCLIEAIDGSGKYEPITSKDFLDYMFSKTY